MDKLAQERLVQAIRSMSAVEAILPIARAYVDARVSKIAGGAVEVMKQIISRDLFSAQ